MQSCLYWVRVNGFVGVLLLEETALDELVKGIRLVLPLSICLLLLLMAKADSISRQNEYCQGFH